MDRHVDTLDHAPARSDLGAPASSVSGSRASPELEARAKHGSGVRSKKLVFPVQAVPKLMVPGLQRILALMPWASQKLGRSEASPAIDPPSFDATDIGDTALVLLNQAKLVTSPDAAMPVIAQLLVSLLGTAMRTATRSKVDASLTALQGSGLDRLLVEALVSNKLLPNAEKAHHDRFVSSLAAKTLDSKTLIAGILAFDAAAQRLASVPGKTWPFEYPIDRNGPRDKLVTYAQSLYR